MTDADRSTNPPSTASTQRTRLQIEGVRSPVLARVARRRDSGMTCVQELPFLRLESAVTDEQGRRARIARVALSVDNDMPKLVIELAYDDHDDDFPSGPPGVAVTASTPRRLESYDAHDTVPGALAPEHTRLVFHRDPIDSLREPPLSLRELSKALVGSLVTRVSAGLRELRSYARMLVAAPPRWRLA